MLWAEYNGRTLSDFYPCNDRDAMAIPLSLHRADSFWHHPWHSDLLAPYRELGHYTDQFMTLQRNLNALLVFLLAMVLLGGYGVQFFLHKQPCPLCMLQRLGMIGVASGALLNLKFGIRTAHYALCLLSALFGGSIALRQITMHICPGMPIYGVPIFGLNLYTWSFIVFVCSILMVALLLALFDPKESPKEAPLNAFSKSAFFLIFIVAFANVITTLMQCGLTSCE